MIYGSKTETWKVYEGEWNEGLEEGYGKLIFKNGDKYEGEFDDSRFSGKGKFTWVDGDTYEGEFENGEHSGYGEYFGANGFVYKGGFLNGYYHGKGTLISSDGSKYVGNFENHFENGYGEKTFKKDLEEEYLIQETGKVGLLTEKGKWFMLTAQFLREFLKTVKRLRDRES